MESRAMGNQGWQGILRDEFGARPDSFLDPLRKIGNGIKSPLGA
jgi:hypothetical protein